jgi:hypothetical protein
MAVGLIDNVLCFLGLQSAGVCSQGVTVPVSASGGDLLTGMPNAAAIGVHMQRWLKSPDYRSQLAAQGAPYGTTPVEFRGKNNWQAIVKQQDFAGAGIAAFKRGDATPSAAAIGAEAQWIKAMLRTGKVEKMEIGGPTEWVAPRVPFLNLPFPCLPPTINLSSDPPTVGLTEAFRVLGYPRIARPRYANKDARDALAMAAAAGNIAVIVYLANDIKNCLLSLVSLLQGKTTGSTGPSVGSGAPGQCGSGQVLVSANCTGIGQTQFCVEKSLLGGGLVQPVKGAGCSAGQVGLRATIKGQDCSFCVDSSAIPAGGHSGGGGGALLGGLGDLAGILNKVPVIAIVAVGAGLLILVLSSR